MTDEPMTRADWRVIQALAALLVVFWLCVAGAIVATSGFLFLCGAVASMLGMGCLLEWWSLR